LREIPAKKKGSKSTAKRRAIFEHTTKICFDFYKREQHQKTKKIAELSDPSNRILIKWIKLGHMSQPKPGL
jgi:hypothetical protein